MPDPRGGEANIGNPNIRSIGDPHISPWERWFWEHGGEDPWWGTRLGQIAMALTIHRMAAKISDPAVANEIRTASERHVTQLAQEEVRGEH